MDVSVTRSCELRGPFELCAENANDWTHFVHLHRKSHAEFRLLHSGGGVEIFLYRAKVLSWLPFIRSYLVCRWMRPEQAGYEQVYIHLPSGKLSYLSSSTLRRGANAVVQGEFLFEMGEAWRLWPGLLAWIFRRRMRAVMEEDNALLRERIRLGSPDDPAACAAPPPAAFEALRRELKERRERAACRFEASTFDDLLAP